MIRHTPCALFQLYNSKLIIMERAVDYNVEVSKEFTVPVERLYQAWTTEEDLKDGGL